ncbi:peptidoglycan editing factor PgeF [Leucothrix arctica]|uniref:Purine nucleoside phosphorylase n=1 Tax=Leucothrix arctica TaxID=1481894 RepID=A0A317C511_9GAMM|nr:peptidoglycan editing factor PgeF [Leucothrix arctica]PWQ93776.1 peptidoglycan editing factor PgeF [Leucothrix arctica]
MSRSAFIYPDWPAPDNIKAVMTTRHGGVSLPPFDGLNLGDHVDDDPEAVQTNRKQLAVDLSLPQQPAWLSQVHGINVASCSSAKSTDVADAIVGKHQNDVCSIMTADCLPVLFCDKQGTVIAAAHAGWRGLASGVLEATIAEMTSKPQDILIWMGAAIGPDAFEVGSEVRDVFIAQHSESTEAFKAQASGKWLADIYKLALIRFKHSKIPVENVYGGGRCTYSEDTEFYSYRRESRTGRMASLIWRT